MSHYTYASGVLTATVTVRCPICTVQRIVPVEVIKKRACPLEVLCCPEHAKVYQDRVEKIERMCWRALKGKVRLPGIILGRLKTTCVISRLTSNWLKEYVQ